ncbi:MAG TPA: hypothetical protein VHT70_04910, partial [Candidatus Saccharimonadales bacterium]|nr:hypothetical protein [Candidatus Saccharimonadales bacterium]
MNEFLNQPDSNAPDFTSFPHAMADFELPPQAELEIQEPAPHTDAVPQLPQAEGGEHAVPLPQQTEASDATYRPYFSFNATDVDPAVTEKLERIRQDAESHRALRLPGENPVTDE